MATKALGKDYRLDKNGKLIKVKQYRDVSARIAARKRPKTKVVRGTR